MGSATTFALVGARATLYEAALGVSREEAVRISEEGRSRGADPELGMQLLTSGRVVGSSKQLLAVFTDLDILPSKKESLVRRLFGRSLGDKARSIFLSLVESRWSRSADLLAAIEEIGIRALVMSAPDDVSVQRELFEVGRTIVENSNLELALGSRLGTSEAKCKLVERLFRGKVSDQTIEISQHLVCQPRGRRLRELFEKATKLAGYQEGHDVAIVTVARALNDEQLRQLEKTLSEMYSRSLRVNQIVDPAIIGGVRVQLDDDVIDGTVSSRLNDLRLRLAG